jgi:hypothetical protein
MAQGIGGPAHVAEPALAVARRAEPGGLGVGPAGYPVKGAARSSALGLRAYHCASSSSSAAVTVAAVTWAST